MWFGWGKKKEIEVKLRPMVSVRMEAIGGQGANSAGKILAEAAVLGMKYTGNHFSSFGSEKRGSPVRSFARFSPERKVVRSASFIRQPDLLMVFHESLLFSHPEILEGVDENTDLVLNSTRIPRNVVLPQGIVFRDIITLDATTLAVKNQCGINAVMLGAAASKLPEIQEEELKKSLGRFFSRLPVKVQEANLAGFIAGSKKAMIAPYGDWMNRIQQEEKPLPQMGYLNAPLGGLILNPGNTVLKDNSASRKGTVPRLLTDVCFHCGYCDMVCPDYCFVWEKRERSTPQLRGIDYQFCKGCQKCIVACPVQALVPVRERDLSSQERSHHLFPEANAHAVREKWSKADWSEIVSELSPEAKMLTLQTELLDPQTYIRPDFSEVLRKKKEEEDK